MFGRKVGDTGVSLMGLDALQILALVALTLGGFALRDWLKQGRGRLSIRQRTWLMVAGIFLVVIVYLRVVAAG
jgi:hypothetical protein